MLIKTQKGRAGRGIPGKLTLETAMILPEVTYPNWGLGWPPVVVLSKCTIDGATLLILVELPAGFAGQVPAF